MKAAKFMKFAPAIAGFLLYAFLTTNHGFVLDDDLVITSNTHVQEGLAGIGELFSTNYAHGHQGFNDGLYRPLSLVTFALEKSLTNLNPGFSHFLQALLYGLCIFLLHLWLVRLLGSDSKWPFWIAMIFALHPIHTEVVANLKSRDELMAMIFFLASMIPFTRWLHSQRMTDLLYTCGLFLVALFSKESAITFLAAYPLLIWKQKLPVNQGLTAMGLLAVPTALFLGVRWIVLENMGPVDEGITSLLQNSLVQADGMLDQFAGAAYIQWMYIVKLFFPFELVHDYSYNAIPFYPLASFIGLATLVGVLALAGVGLWGMYHRKWYGFGILFYFATISVVANVLLLIGATAAERFLFAPSLGWCFVVVAIFTSTPLLRKWSTQSLTAYCVIFLALSGMRIPDWESNYALFSADIDKSPNSARAHYNLGTKLNEEAQRRPREKTALLQEAQKHLYEAIEIYPEYQDAYNNLGISFMNNQRYEEAVNVYSELLSKFPEYSKGRYNLANSYFRMQNYGKAEAQYEAYYGANPNYLDALYMAAECEGFQQKFQEAVAHLEKLVKAEPQRDRGWLKLGVAYATLGRPNDGVQHLNQAIKINPGNTDARFNMALIYANSGQPNEAIGQLQMILRQSPQNAQAQQLLSQLQVGN